MREDGVETSSGGASSHGAAVRWQQRLFYMCTELAQKPPIEGRARNECSVNAPQFWKVI